MMSRQWMSGPRAVVFWIGLTMMAGVAFLAPSFEELTASLEPNEAHAAASATPAPAEVMHFWNAGSERDALNVIRDAYMARHGTWIDSEQPDHRSLRQSLMDRFSTDTPPVAVLWQSNIELRDLAELGLFSRLDTIAARENWDAVLAPAVRARVQVDGHYYMAPTNIHGLNWIFYNAPMLERLGVGQPRTWDDILDAMQRAEAAGERPIALGPGEWEALIAFGTILAGTLGRDDYRRLILQQDAAVLDKPSALEAFRIFGEIRDIAHRYRPYEDWAHAARAVARGEAAFEFMGDWAKGEMMRAGGRPGVEIGCMLAPGSENALVVTIDGFAFPTAQSASQVAARDALASLMLDRSVQERFAFAKGTLPARMDATPAQPDICEEIMIARLRDPQAPMEPPNAGLPSATAGDYQISVAAFYNDPSMTPEQGLATLAAVFRN